MTRKSKNIATFGTIAALAAASVFVPVAAASAAETECEPGYVDTSFTSSASQLEPVSSITGTNPEGATISQTFTVGTTSTTSHSFTGSMSFDSVLSPLKAQVSGTAASSFSWDAGTTIGPIDIPAGQTVNVIYGFATVSFAGSQRTCQSNGLFGPSSSFSGTAPTGVYTSA